MNYTQHPLSAAFPSMNAEDFQSLKDSIEASGVLNPITIYEGQVIDGWHRYKAATELAMDCPSLEMELWIDPKDFVLAQNKNRRHITSAQLADAATAVYAWYPSVGVNQYTKSAPALSAAPQKTTAEMAASAGVSERSIRQAKEVHTNATPAVKQAVKDGKIGLPKAVAISKMAPEVQAAAIDKPLPKKTVADFNEAHAKKREAEREASSEAMLEIANMEIQSLREVLALGDLPEHERLDAKDLIDTLKEENKTLKAQIKVVESQRDQYMATVSEMERQIKYLNRRA